MYVSVLITFLSVMTKDLTKEAEGWEQDPTNTVLASRPKLCVISSETFDSVPLTCAKNGTLPSLRPHHLNLALR